MKRLLLAGSFLAVVVAAQQTGGPQQKAGSVGSGPKKSTQSKATPRPSPAIGNNIVQVIDSLVAAGATKGKGEYETTREYESRTKAAAARYGQLSFLVPDANFTYDADQAEMKVRVLMFQEFYGDSTSAWPTLYLRSKLVRKTSYTGTNEYGATALIHSSTYSVHGIAITPGSSVSFSFKNDPENAELTFSMQADEARLLKPFLRVVLVGKLTEGRVYEGQHTEPATLHVPVALMSSGLFIPFRLEKVQVIDIRSGNPVKSILRQKDESVSPGVDSEPHPDVSPSSVEGSGGGTEGGVYRVGGGVTAPVVLYKVDPEYSEEARKAKYSGTVVLYIEVDTTGHARNMRVVKGIGLGLDEKAQEAVNKWRFKPGLKDGKPVTTETTVEVSFRLL